MTAGHPCAAPSRATWLVQNGWKQRAYRRTSVLEKNGGASAIRSCGQSARERHVAPKAMGADLALKRIDAHGALIPATSQQELRLFLRELRGRLATQGGQTSASGPSHFF